MNIWNPWGSIGGIVALLIAVVLMVALPVVDSFIRDIGWVWYVAAIALAYLVGVLINWILSQTSFG